MQKISYLCRGFEKLHTMEAATIPQRLVQLSIPQSDYRFVRSLSNKMGWTIHKTRRSGLQRAIDDVRAGRVYEAASVDDLIAQLESWSTPSDIQVSSSGRINFAKSADIICPIWKAFSAYWRKMVLCLRNIRHISLLDVNGVAIGSAISSLIGFWFGIKMIQNLYFYCWIPVLTPIFSKCLRMWHITCRNSCKWLILCELCLYGGG